VLGSKLENGQPDATEAPGSASRCPRLSLQWLSSVLISAVLVALDSRTCVRIRVALFCVAFKLGVAAAAVCWAP
jgi:hypothetical protein